MSRYLEVMDTSSKIDLASDIGRLRLRNPLIIASGPNVKNLRDIEKAFRYGAGGVVTKTITFDPMQQVQPKPRMFIVDTKSALSGRYFSFYSVDLMSEYPPTEWTSIIREAKRRLSLEGGVIIASIAGRTYDEWEKLAQLVSDAEADAIELNLSCPHIEEREGKMMGRAVASSPHIVKNIIRIVKKTTGLPVIGKLTPHGAPVMELASSMVEGGVDILTATARFRGLIIDEETLSPIIWGSFGGYGGPWQLPISLAWVAELSMRNLGVPIIGSGGIFSGHDIVKFVLVGASAIQTCTAIIIHGYEAIPKMLADLKEWMERHGFTRVSEFRGLALSRIAPIEKVNRDKIYVVRVTERCTNCLICVKTCPYEAIHYNESREGRVKVGIDMAKCENCGLCYSICPFNAIEMVKAD